MWGRKKKTHTHTFIPRENQHIQEINGHFDGTLYYFVTMIFASNQEQNEPWIFKEMLLKLEKTDFIPSTIREV